MIKYALVCENDHEFEAWFQNGDAYEIQAAKSLIACPTCASHQVAKAIMAPAVATKAASALRERAIEPSPVAQIPASEMQHVMRRLREEVHGKAEYVGSRFAEEARRIHFDESPERGIYGEASAEEVRSLAEDGVPFFPLPRLPEDMN